MCAADIAHIVERVSPIFQVTRRPRKPRSHKRPYRCTGKIARARGHEHWRGADLNDRLDVGDERVRTVMTSSPGPMSSATWSALVPLPTATANLVPAHVIDCSFLGNYELGRDLTVG